LSVAQGLFLRALRICSSEFLDDEISFIKKSLSELAYPNFILDKALSRAKSTFYKPRTSTNPVVSSTPTTSKIVSLPYTPSLDSPCNHRLAKSFNTKLIFSYPNTLKSNLVRNSVNQSRGEVYKIPCRDCNKFYIGETGRNLKQRIKEHKTAIQSFNTNNGLAVHSINSGHTIDFCNSSVLAQCSDTIKRRVIESAYIQAHENNSLNLNSGFYSSDKVTSRRIVNSFS